MGGPDVGPLKLPPLGASPGNPGHFSEASQTVPP
jgi:hypothetical protein